MFRAWLVCWLKFNIYLTIWSFRHRIEFKNGPVSLVPLSLSSDILLAVEPRNKTVAEVLNVRILNWLYFLFVKCIHVLLLLSMFLYFILLNVTLNIIFILNIFQPFSLQSLIKACPQLTAEYKIYHIFASFWIIYYYLAKKQKKILENIYYKIFSLFTFFYLIWLLIDTVKLVKNKW